MKRIIMAILLLFRVKIKWLLTCTNSSKRFICCFIISIASLNGHLEIVKFLIESGSNINDKNNYGSSGLYWGEE